MKTRYTPASPSKYLSAKTLAFAGTVVATSMAYASTDYGPAQWYADCNYSTSGYGKRFFVEHDMEGYFWPSVVYLSHCSTSASIHYAVNGKKDTSSDSAAGYVVQSVRDAYYAWHVRCWNHYMLGTEHEGFASNPAWYTESLYIASASLTKSKCNKYGIAKDRNHVIGHDQKRISAWVSWMQAVGYSYSFATCNTHGDPGSHWNWSHYMDLVKGGGVSAPSAPSTLAVAVVSTSQLKLTWKDNSANETGFKVERSLSSGSGFAQIGTTGAGVVSYTAGSLASGTKYYFRVRAYNAGGNSGYSGVASGTTKDTIPAAPTALTTTPVSDTQLNLSWTDNSGNEDGFRVYRSTDGTNFTQIATTAINVHTYNNTGLTGNRQYWYRVYSYNTAGNSAVSNTATDWTPPQAPAGLTVSAVSGTTNWNKLDLAWTDNSNAEVGFKVERGTALAGPFTQIGTTAAGVAAYQDSGLGASTTYYYRVRSYNANGNSAYSAVASRATGNAPPVLNPIGNKTVAQGVTLAFTATSSDPNAPAPVTTTWQTFESFPHANPNETVLFNRPSNSASTSAFMDTSTNYTQVFTNGPSAWGTTKALKAGWGFKTGTANYWVRLNTFNTPTNPNPAIALDQEVRFKFYASKAVKVGLGVRETGTTAAYGANGGTTGAIEWVGVTNVLTGSLPVPNRLVAATTAVTLAWNIPFEPQAGFTGDGVVNESGMKGALEHVAIRGEGGTGAYSVWFDDMAVVVRNYRTFSLDAGAPSGATIGRRSGKFSWTPSAAGVYTITVRVTDNLGAQDFETIKVTVTGTGNSAPVLGAIGNKTVKEGVNLAFTATATDADSGQTKTFTLDAGNPSGSSINSSSGAFSWTPTEAQGPGSYPITVRVTDNGSPASNDFETITVTVQEANAAPVLAAIANQTITEGGTLSLTASATDSDIPANSITYSIAGPAGMTINSSSGAISWTTGEDDGGDVDQVTVTATDNGSPALSSSKTFNVTVNEANVAPVVTIGSLNDENPFAQFDELDDESLEGHNNATLFRVPYFSASTTSYLNSTSYSYVTNDFPRDEVVNNSYQALYVNMSFNTGTTNPWCRLTTFTSSTWTNAYAYPNPTIDLAQHVRFKVWSDKSIKVALGVRETGTSNPLGFDGGSTGAIEWVGATTITNGSAVSPVPTHTITASNWTLVDFNLPSETIKAFPGSGNGVLASGKGTLEHLAIVPNGGTGAYNIYLDDLEVLTTKSGSSITVNTLDNLFFTAGATDADRPAQDLTFSLTAAPTNAVIDDASGAFSWTVMPDAPAVNVITVTATDNGSPNLSGSANLTVNVNKINTPPRIAKMEDQVVENGGGTLVTFDATAEDDEGDTLTYSITSGPGSIGSSTGTYSWTPPTGLSTNLVTIRVTDNGSPNLWDEQTVTIIVVPANTTPSLSLGTARATESVVNYESFTNGTPSEQVMFKKPANSATTSSYIDTSVTNYTSVTTSFPAGNANAGAKVLRATWTFKTGTSNYWVRLNTGNTTLLPNPAINASARLKFDIYTTKALKVGLGIRETGTAAENGADGGTTGAIEYVGCSSKVGTTPIPTRTVNATTWTTVEFDLPNEPCQTLTGDSILAGGQQALEHLILVGAGGTGAYDVYLDNFEVVTTTALPGNITMKANSSLTFTASGSDPDPGAGLLYGMDPDFQDAHTNAIINETNGVFTWTPGATDAGTTNALTVSVEDQPTNGGIVKTATSSAFNIIVTADTLGPQAGGSTFVAGGASVTLTWSSVAGASYAVQAKAVGASDWTTVQSVTATGASAAVTVTNNGEDANYRIVEASSSDE